MSGPSTARSGTSVTYTSSVCGGTGSYTYEWRKSLNGYYYDSADIISTSSSATTTMPASGNLYVRLDIRSSDGQSKLVSYTTYPGSGSYLVPEETPGAPTAHLLHAAYPNPSNGLTRIGYDLPEAAHVELAVYDVLGRKVAVLMDGHHESGFYEAAFDVTGLPNGVYVYRIQAGGYSASRTLVVAQ